MEKEIKIILELGSDTEPAIVQYIDNTMGEISNGFALDLIFEFDIPLFDDCAFVADIVNEWKGIVKY